MKKYLILLPALALIGAGCAGSTSVETTTNPSAQLDSSTTAVEQVAEEEAVVDASNVETNAAGEQVIVSDGAEIVVQTSTEASAEAEEEDGVPVTDVVLGGEDQNIDMVVGNFSYEPKTITAAPGEKIKITFTKNVGFHTFVIDEIGLKHAIKQGEAVSFTAPSKPGSYAYYCDVGSHRANGMEGVLIVK